MRIENYLLKDVDYIKSPNFKKKFISEKLKYLIMHFTGGTTLEGVVNTFLNKDMKVSAHIIIDRDGTVIQMVPFNYIAWHAGKSEWKGKKWLNNYSIGIEFVNVGKLTEKNGIYKDYWDHEIDFKNVCIQNPNFFMPYVKVKEFHELTYWQCFTDIQIEKGLEITKLLLQEYNLIDILGHSDISPGRKIDPGPAFPMNKFKKLLNG